jgi:hypothetical protein
MLSLNGPTQEQRAGPAAPASSRSQARNQSGAIPEPPAVFSCKVRSQRRVRRARASELGRWRAGRLVRRHSAAAANHPARQEAGIVGFRVVVAPAPFDIVRAPSAPQSRAICTVTAGGIKFITERAKCLQVPSPAVPVCHGLCE